MADTNEKKYLSLAGLNTYDTKIKEHIQGKIDDLAEDHNNLGLAITDINTDIGNRDNLTAKDGEGKAKDLVSAINDAAAAAKANADVLEEITDSENGILAQANAETAKVDAKVGDTAELDTAAKDNLVDAINEVRDAVSAGSTAAAITIDTAETTAGALKSYTIKQGENVVGTIDIPKDMVVQSGRVVVDPEGQTAGTYIELVLANVDEPLYINVGTLVDLYTVQANAAQIQLAMNGREISATVVAGSIGADELAANAVVTAKITDGNVTKAKLHTDVQASLDKADAALPKATYDAYIEQETADEAEQDRRIKAVEDSLATGGATANAIANAQKAADDAADAIEALETGKVKALEDKVVLGGSYTTVEGAIAGEIKKVNDANAEAFDGKVDKVTGKSLVDDDEIAKLETVSEGANKVEAGDANGYIKIDGDSVKVYEHPASHTAAEISDFATEVAKVKVAAADFADEATKAVQDGNGKVIADTYAEKATTLAGYGIGDAYTKGEVDSAIENAVGQFVEITDAEINAMFA